jgi:hypothetical protein
MKNEYNVYIDESGDEGLNRGSKYFVLTAIIVKKEKDLEISKNIDTIKENLEIPLKSQLHWNTVKGFPNKQMITKIISNLDITIVNIIIDTYNIRFIPSKDLYYYFSGYLFERICWIAKENNRKANINISSRGNLKKENLKNYLSNFKNNKKNSIDYNLINSIKIYPNKQKRLLQMADCCCSALGQALKYNDNTHKKYMSDLIIKIYNKKGNYLSYGMKIVPKTNKLPTEIQSLLDYLEIKK